MNGLPIRLRCFRLLLAVSNSAGATPSNAAHAESSLDSPLAGKPVHWLPVLLAGVAWLSVMLTLDAAADVPWSAEGPGVTFDEGFNVEMGVYLTEITLQSGLGGLHPATQYDISQSPVYNPDHPPLGRWILGAANALLARVFPAPDRPYVLTYARCGSATAFGLMVLVIAQFCLRQWGTAGALISSLTLLLMPRLFGHAHLAALETAMNLTFTACVVSLASSWSGKDRLHRRDGLWPGVLLGLALLTKMQAIFLLPAIGLWGLWNWRWRAIVPGLVLGVTALGIFFLGWPWLWSAPLERAAEYFSRSTERITLYCYYLGERYADKDVPWHYPFVMFLTTTPVLFLVLGGWGLSTTLRSQRREEARCGQLLLLAWLLPLTAFAIPGVAVYDGERLFLVCWPVWSVLAAAGGAQLWTRLRQAGRAAFGLGRRIVSGFAVIGVLSPLASLVMLHPCELSYYNELVGGLHGAVALGFEPTYWGDGATSKMLSEGVRSLPEGSRLAVAPLLHPATLTFLKRDSTLRFRPDLILEPYDDQKPDGAKHVLVIRRHADPWKSLSPPPEGTRALSVEQRGGAPLAEILELP